MKLGFIASLLFHMALLAALGAAGAPPTWGDGLGTGAGTVPVARLQARLVGAISAPGAPQLTGSATQAPNAEPTSSGLVEEVPPPLAGDSGGNLVGQRVARPDEGGVSLDDYLPADTLDLPPVPVTEPDMGMLDGLQPSGLPIRIRLFVDADGKVQRMDVLAADVSDAAFTERLRAMFLATRFVAGVRGSQSLASYRDLELSFSEVPKLPDGTPVGER